MEAFWKGDSAMLESELLEDCVSTLPSVTADRDG